MITKTIGVGGDYTDFNSAVIALQTLGVGGITEDYTFRQISNYTNNTAAPVGQIYPNGFTINFTNDNPPMGNPLNGYIISCVTRPTLYTAQPAGGRGRFIFDELYFKANGLASDLVWIQTAQELFPFAQWKDRRVDIRNCMFDGNGTAAASLNCRSAEYSYWLLSNLKIWGHKSSGLRFGNAGVIPNPGETTKIIENVTILNEVNNSIGILSNTLGDAGSDDTDYKNVISCSNGVAVGTKDWSDSIQPGRIIVNNCASSDATCPLTYGTGNIININPATEFKSLDDTNADFLKLEETADFTASSLNVTIGENVNINSFLSGTGQLYQTGSTNIQSWNTEDIAGSQRPDIEGKVSIGAHEQTEITGYSWSLDDGKTSTSSNPSVSYSIPGLKTISVVLTYIDGSTETIIKPDYINVTGYRLDFVGIPRSGNSPLKTVFYPNFEPL